MEKLNCWQVVRCGREPGGVNQGTFGVCPTTVDGRLTGINDGMCGGRVCWAVPDTHRLGVLSEAVGGDNKLSHCLECWFMHRVEREEGDAFSLLKEVLDRCAPTTG